MKLLLAMLLAVALFAPRPAVADDTATTDTLNKWQRLYLNRTALFRAENEALQPGDRPIVFAGDSLTQALHLDELFPGHLVLNRGIASDGTANFPNAEPPHYRGLVNRYEDSILNAHPRVLFILIGTNDVGMRSIDLSYWEQHLESLIDRVESDLPDCRIILHTLPPSGPPYSRVESLNERAVEYNDLLKALAARRNLPIIDLWEIYASPEGILPSDVTNDGLHLKREAHERWAAAARPYFTSDGSRAEQ
ncbi:MAG: hypothetical protein PWP23_3096 [Candidatus Sumerlaeota bacterium]|nr:hypothetical protein [Candidatus Sumerlaeota bacterium]